jgi:hypothetical protein
MRFRASRERGRSDSLAMPAERQRFKTRKGHDEFQTFIDTWDAQEKSTKSPFLHLCSKLLVPDGVQLDFLPRPGVSYSLRAERRLGEQWALFALVDVVDDEPEKRWLSVCFYANTVSDPQKMGNLIPGGIRGKDGYCFDIFEEDQALVSYLAERIEEASDRIGTFDSK